MAGSIATSAPAHPIMRRSFRTACSATIRGQKFQDVTTSGGFGQLQKGHAISFADFNRDGNEDIFEVLGGAAPGDTYPDVLLENPGHANHWVGSQARRRESQTAPPSARE
jgi:hypothetical protein